MEKRVLLIDDDPTFIQRLREALGNHVNLHVVSVADEAVATCQNWRPHLILLDVLIAPGDPFRILDELSSHDPGQQAALLCLSRGAGSTTRLQSFGNTVFGTLKRETDTAALLATIFDALGVRETVAA